eukprot:scaffold3064_cov231-Pinguiococcus_pyrenoidosus.AAC.6
MHGMQAVHVFRGRNRAEHHSLVHVVGQRQLHEDSMYIRVLIELQNRLREPILTHSGVEMHLVALNPHIFARATLKAHIRLAVRARAHAHHRQLHLDVPTRAQNGHIAAQLAL